MMLLQRLNERGTQQEAVHQVAAGRLDHLLADCKRVREGEISQNTGGYARACERMAVEVVKKVCDQLLTELSKRIELQAELEVPLLLLDGSARRAQSTEDQTTENAPSAGEMETESRLESREREGWVG